MFQAESSPTPGIIKTNNSVVIHRPVLSNLLTKPSAPVENTNKVEISEENDIGNEPVVVAFFKQQSENHNLENNKLCSEDSIEKNSPDQ